MQPIGDNQPPKPAQSTTWRQWIQKTRGFWFIGLALLALVFIHIFIARPYRVDGASMQPTLYTNDHLIVWKAGHIKAWLTGSQYVPKRGEIVVLKSPVGDDVLIKRVVGLPNEKISIGDGKITIINNDNPFGFEPNLNTSPDVIGPHDNRTYPQLANDEIFVIGDNRWPGQSHDSRYFAQMVKLDDIIGDAVIRVLPLNHISRF